MSKIITALCAVIVLATAASAQTAPQRKPGAQPYTNFEKLWFSMPQGEEG